MEGLVTEIPSYLKQLARLVARGFYQIEDSLIIDMLVRNTCMKEKDLEELLKFDLKMLRGRMSTLKNEKFVQLRLRMETGLDGKAQKVNYYFINYKSLVNVIKYKLDHMRKRMETQERDATNRASFKCTNCGKTFTDLEAGELFDPETSLFYCTFCRQIVEEDSSAQPTDTRLMLARFNEQMQMLFDLLRKAEDIKLAPELLEPEPPRSFNDMNDPGNSKNDRDGVWSGEATRSLGFNDKTRIDIQIGDEANNKPREERKERPVWMTESTVGDTANSVSTASRPAPAETTTNDRGPREDIMSVLLTYEKKGGTLHKPLIPGNDSDSDGEDPDNVNIGGIFGQSGNGLDHALNRMDVDDDVGVMDSDDEDQVPLITVGSDKIPINEINDLIIARMTPAEEEAYIQQYQDLYAHMYD